MGDGSDTPEVSRDARIGKLALERGWVTPLQLREALSEQWAEVESGRGRTRSLGAILVSKGILTDRQLDELLEKVVSTVPSFPPFGKYNLVRELGRGAMGVVYEAEDTELHRRVALKMLIVSPGRDPEESKPEQERFLRESQLHKSLPPHPGIVPVLEAGVIDGRRYLAMEFVAGASMGAWARAGSVTTRQRVAMLRDVALAVHHAHQHGILHRDLKPENILVDKNHQARITDFGVAKMIGPAALPLATATGVSLGTPAYMSPEQVRGAKDLDARSDLYALGVMLYELLTGRRPFRGETPYEIMMKTVNEEVVPPSKITNLQINPVLYRNLENICLIALAKNPADRYPDAAGFARDLTLWLKGDDRKIVVPRSWRIWRARKLVVWLAGAAALLAAAVGVAVVARPSKKKAPAPIVRAEPLQPGAIAEAYSGVHFNALGLRKIDQRTRFDDPEQPLWPEGTGGWTSQRWSGQLRVPSAGTYLFEIRCREQVRLAIDDVDVYAGTGSSARPTALQEGVHRFVLETSHLGPNAGLSLTWKKEGETAALPLGPGTLLHAARDFKPVSPQAANRTVLGPVPGAEEGETLAVLHDSGQSPIRKSYAVSAAFWKGGWSGSEHLWWGRAVSTGDRLRLRFAAGETARGTLVLALTRASDHGIFKVSVNGAPIAGALDLWSDELFTQEIEFKNVALKAGANELEFEVVGTNPAAREWGPGTGLFKLGLDYVLVR
jgi:serine/threonine-protein kinase